MTCACEEARDGAIKELKACGFHAEYTRHAVSAAVYDAQQKVAAPVPMLLSCPMCSARHIDLGEFATKEHHTHACQNCGHVWRPAVVMTVGVQFLPGFKNDEEG